MEHEHVCTCGRAELNNMDLRCHLGVLILDSARVGAATLLL